MGIKSVGPLAFTATIAFAMNSYAANNSVPGVSVSVLVTAEAKSGAALDAAAVHVEQGKNERTILGLKKLPGSSSQILLLIDESAGGSFDNQILDLKKFVNSLPESVEVGVGYMRNGLSQMTGDFTADHAKAANSIRLALGLGGADVSPYDSLSEAVKKWPVKAGVARREVIMISSGLEGLGGGFPPDNPYVNAGIADAQKAGVTVYAIYNPVSGHAGHSLWQSTIGQGFLSQLTDATGGELYTSGVGSAVSSEPFLADIANRQSQQYVLTFEARAEKKSGLQQVKISSTEKGLSLAAPDKVYVKASL